MRRDEDHVGRRVMDMVVEGRQRRGWPRRQWMECVQGGMMEKSVAGGLRDKDKGGWRLLVKHSSPMSTWQSCVRRRKNEPLYMFGEQTE